MFSRRGNANSALPPPQGAAMVRPDISTPFDRPSMTFNLHRRLAASLTVLAGVSLALLVGLAPSAQAQRSGAAQQAPAKAGPAPKANPAYRPSFGPGPVVIPYNRKVWPQSYSDLPADPNILYGTLPNGMRYAIMKNATPPGQAALRMVVQAGSLHERDDQQGLAHFLEHMAFNGSKNVPEGEMIRTLARLGLSFGADTNASTGATRTTYQLDLPRTNDETVDTALMLFREAASELTIAPEAVEKERGVVLSEERSRDDPDYRMYKSELAFFGQDSLVVRRMPIGLPEVLRTAPASTIRDYYETYYRPDRTTVIAVGDFDVAAMEAKIKARFTDWRPKRTADPEPALTLPARRGSETKVMIEPNGRLAVSVNWIMPPDLSPDTRAKRTADIIQGFGLAIMNRRVDRLARSANPPYSGGGIGLDTVYDTQTRANLDVTAQPGRWQEALGSVIAEQRRMVQFGITQDELNRELAETRTGLAAADARSATRSTPGLANMIAGSVDGSIVINNPRQNLDFFNEVASQITVANVNASMRELFSGSGPLVFIGSPTPIEGGAGTVTQTLTAALAAPVAASESVALKPWNYTSFGTPGKVAEQQEILDLNTTFIRFENGVRLTVRPSNYRKDQILISVRVGAGLLGLPTDRTPVTWTLPTAFMDGGLRDLTAEEVERVMAEKVVGVGMNFDVNALGFAGSTRPADLDTEMQMLAAYVTAPGWRTEAFQRMKTLAITARDEQDATSGGVLGRELSVLLRSGDKRYAFPTQAEITGAQPNDVRAILERDLAGGPIDIVIVGDITVAKATAAVAATFGAMPARPASGWTAPPRPVANFPAPSASPVVLTHKGRPDDTLAFIAWKTTDFFSDPRKARTLRLLAAIMQIRLTEEVRENLGATYSPGASSSNDSVFPGYGFIYANVETTPDKMAAFYGAVNEIVAEMRNAPVSDDLLNRARAPLIEATQRNIGSSNEFWLTQLTDAQKEAWHLPAIRSIMADLRTISAADTQAVAREYLAPEKAYKIEVRAQAPASGPRP